MGPDVSCSFYPGKDPNVFALSLMSSILMHYYNNESMSLHAYWTKWQTLPLLPVFPANIVCNLKQHMSFHKFSFCPLKVCRKLGIIEVDYFGLQFSGSKGENLWLNLRNRICQQMDNLTPCRLRLRVKFFVEPHLILQEQTRYVFTNVNAQYINIYLHGRSIY